ncbi:MAG: hypothetical protein K6G12_06120 [Lachnospiraceae bacterium]|nr:hypothetical protein [Lachnospiraceae bacterium]
MRQVWIANEETAYFAQLAPENIMALVGLPNYFALGIVDDDDTQDIPAAITIFSMNPGGKSIVHWFYVAPEYRLEGLGSELLATLNTMNNDTESQSLEILVNKDKAEKSNVAGIRLGKDDENEIEDVSEFFEDRGFHIENALPGSWRFPANKLMEQTFFFKALKKEKEIKDVIPLRNLKKADIEILIRDYIQDLPDSIPWNLSSCDLDYSCVIRGKRGFDGVFLIRRAGNVLCPVVLKAKNMDTEEKLVMNALLTLYDHEDSDEEVMIVAYRSQVADKMDWYFPSIKAQSAVLLRE